MELFDYQKKAVEFIKDKKKVYLALDLGMGKTITSLYSLIELGKKNILVIAEKNEIVNSQNFKKEVETYFEIPYHSLRSEKGGTTSVDWDLPNERCVCGANPDLLSKIDDKKIAELFDSLIIDEATLIKTTTTKRFKKVHKVAKEVDYLVLLSGTPMMNGASEIYAPMLLLDNPLVAGKGAKGKKAFETIFAGGHNKQIKKLPAGMNKGDVYRSGKGWMYFAWWAKGANNLRELRYLLRDSFFILSKNETGVFKKKVRRIEFVPMTLVWLNEYQKAWQEYLVEAKKRDVDMENVTQLRNLIENGQCYQVNSRWKAKKVVEDVVNGKYGSERIIIFSLFIETDKIIQNELTNLGVSFRTFEELNEWKEGTEQVLVGRIKSHNKGGNVPEASVCLFVDMDYVPANNIQAENRVDRPQQKKDMLIVYYQTQGDDIVDTHIRNINRTKVNKISKFMTPLSEKEEAEMDKKLTELRIKYPSECSLLGI